MILNSDFKYVINSRTELIMPEYDQYGNLYSHVKEGDYSFLVKMSPKQLLDYSMMYYGSSLLGGLQTSKFIFGKVRILPLLICEQLDLFFFPTHSINNDKCIWFSLSHVWRIKEIDHESAEVILYSGHSIIVHVSKSRLKNRKIQASHLRYTIQSRLEKTKTFLYLSNKKYIKEEDEGEQY